MQYSYFIKLFDNALKICAKYDERSKVGCSVSSLSNQFRNELIKMGYLIAIQDGSLDRMELTTLNDLMGVVLDPEFLAQNYFEDTNLQNSFLRRVPNSIMYVTYKEKEVPVNLSGTLTDTRALYEVFKQFGYIMISCNQFKFYKEVKVMESFSNIMISYILQNECVDWCGIDGNPNQLPEESFNININVDNTQRNPTFINNETQEDQNFQQEKLFDYDLLQNIRKRSENYNNNTSVNSTDKAIKKENMEQRVDISKRIDMNDKPEKVEDIIKDLDNMIGLESVKQEVHNLVNLLKVRKLREDRGFKQPSIAMHLVFVGNPGTGKTTVARKLAKIYKCLGILEKGHLIETDRSGMIAGYMGQTTEKVTELIDSALGGILFIDEAYALINNKQEGDFGQEAIDTLLKQMEDRRGEFIVIVAGYPEPMEKFLDANPGLRSRFNKFITFDDYNITELFSIFEGICKENDYTFDEEVKDKVLLDIGNMLANKNANFANAREIRTYFENVVNRQANRIVEKGITDSQELLSIRVEDLEEKK